MNDLDVVADEQIVRELKRKLSGCRAAGRIRSALGRVLAPKIFEIERQHGRSSASAISVASSIEQKHIFYFCFFCRFE
jgi:hypothetical protein